MRTLLRILTFWGPVVFWASAVHGQVASDGEYIVKMRSHSSALHSKLQGKASLKSSLPLKNAYHIDAKAHPEVIEELKNDPDVEYVEPNFKLQAIEGLDGSNQVGAQQAQKRYDQTGAAVRATEAWQSSSAASNDNRPIVAIIDTGLDANHVVFTATGAVWVNTREIPGNGIDDDHNGYVDDVNGWNFLSNSSDFHDDEDHGTHVAGIVLGATQDILADTQDLEPAKIRIMPLKFLDGSGAGTTAAAINAVYYAVDNGAKVINCSWGGSSYSRALHEAITFAYQHGVLVVSAAGNYTSNNDATALYPANYDVPSNIAVAATSDSDRLASFSNYGRTTVSVAAPGVAVFSTIPGDWFASYSGTSMAAPLVAGAAALASREAPGVSGYQLKNLITASVDRIAGLSNSVSSSGRININSMVSMAKTMVSTSAYQPDYSPVYQADTRSPASDDGASGSKGGCGLVVSTAAMSAGGKGGGKGGGLGGAIIAFLLMAPLALALHLRLQSRATGRNRRRFERFVMESAIVIKAGDRELVGETKTISLGGLSFSADELLEKGGRVQMRVFAPDGKTVIDVEGQIVWNVKDKSYGVQFGAVEDKVRRAIQAWSSVLVRT